MKFSELRNITQAEWLTAPSEQDIVFLVLDSRKSRNYDHRALFIALRGKNHDGHEYIEDAYRKGIRNFLVSRAIELPGNDAHVLKVDDTLHALQEMGRKNRVDNQSLEVIAITGSNGKTIVKEWLATMLSPFRHLVRSPGSFNSQVGVPLSLWLIQPGHETGIFEAGISTTGEMEKLAHMIQPTIGIFTNIGEAHQAGFSSIEEKVREKMTLFDSCNRLIYCRDHSLVHDAVSIPSFTWGFHEESKVRILEEEKSETGVYRLLAYNDRSVRMFFPFSDHASLENAMHVIASMLMLGYEFKVIQEGLIQLRPMAMRLELKRGIHNATLIDDTYNNDISGIQTAIDFMSQQASAQGKILILSDVLQSEGSDWLDQVYTLAQGIHAEKIIGIGPAWMQFISRGIPFEPYASTEDFIDRFDQQAIKDKLVLIKGARPFKFEKITSLLEEKVHGTVLEVDLGAVTSNLNVFRQLLDPSTKLMVMVKAFAYGSGSLEVARMLAFHRVDYLGVAYIDEGIYLRNQGIQLPIMVMNPSVETVDSMITYNLEPEIYSEKMLMSLVNVLGDRSLKIHLKLDTGMHRLGFEDAGEWVNIIKSHPYIRVASVFTHLSSSDDPSEDAFTKAQIARFTEMSEELSKNLGYTPVRHILNSSGILRFPDYQLDMVRLGIGLHGIGENPGLIPVNTLRSYISQIKHLAPGETVGYNRRGKVTEPKTIATIALGYADGYSRAFSNGQGKVWVNGKLAPVIGNVCMDMTMIDITGIEASEGDQVEVFGPSLTVETVAEWAGTIPYELLTDVSQRVRRIYVN